MEPSSSIPTSLPALTTIWTSPEFCSTHWTYMKASGDFYTYISQDWKTTSQGSPCRVPGWDIASGVFSPGVCPYQWTTWKSQVISGSITSAMCCPRGYINQHFDCASLYSTTRSSVTVVTEYEEPPVISEVPPGTAVLSGVHVLYQESDLSLLPKQQTVLITNSKDNTISRTTSRVATSTATSAIKNDGQGNNNSSGLSTGSIAGIAVGSGVRVLLILVAMIYLWRTRRKTGEDDGVGAVAELHGQDHTAHEIPTVEKPVEVDGTSPAVELPASELTTHRHVDSASGGSPSVYYFVQDTGQWPGPSPIPVESPSLGYPDSGPRHI